MFQIMHGIDNEDFTEAWTQVYPDKLGSGRYSLNLKIYGVTVRQIPFVFCDGGRISVPMPEMKVVDGRVSYFWKKGSLEYKLAKLVGSFYIYNDIEGVAARSKISII